MNYLRNNRVIGASAFLLGTISPAIVFIALLRVCIDPILSWTAQYIRPYLGEAITTTIFCLANAIAVLLLLYYGLGLAWWLVKPNLSEPNRMIAASEEFLSYHPNDRYHSGRLTALEREREQRFGVAAPKRGPNPRLLTQ